MSSTSQRPQPLIPIANGDDASEGLSHLVIAAGCQVFAELVELNKKGWQDPALDAHFQNWRNKSGQPSTPDSAFHWLKAYCKSMHFMNRQMNIIPDGPLNFLDLGCAPGGYSKCVLETNPGAIGTGVCLPAYDGGHLFVLPKYLRDRYTVHYADMTKYNLYRGAVQGYGRPLPFSPASFELVILDGHALHTREFNARVPHILLMTQIILALDAVKEGGTLFVKLSKVASLASASVLHMFDSICSSLETIKPKRLHGSRRTFYVIVRGVRREEALERYMDILHQMRREFLKSDADAEHLQFDYERITTLAWLKENYVPRLIELGTPVWEVHKECLASFIQYKGSQKVESDEDKGAQDEDQGAQDEN